jgi:hypothetical protein
LTTDVTADLVTRLTLAGFEDAVEIAALAEASWRLVPRRVPLASLPPGASRFGGLPDAPGGFVWPLRDGRPMELLAQIDLHALQLPGLPPTGWLLHFYDAEEMPWGGDEEDAGGSVTLHIGGAREALRRIPHPRGPAPTRFPCCALDVRPTLDLPSAWDSVFQELGYDYELTDPAGHEILRSLGQVAMAVSGVAEREPYHHLLGNPQLRQPDIRRACELIINGIWPYDDEDWSDVERKRAEKLERGAPRAWRLLLQLDTDGLMDWMWSDAGTLYVMIRRDDLAAGRFDRVLTLLQC